MTISLLPTIHKRWGALASFALLSIACGAAPAAVIVNTGMPVGTTNYTLSSSLQSLGGQFTLGSGNTLAQVEGWIETNVAGSLTVSLWSGAPTVSGSPLFSTTRTLAVGGYGWQAFSGLSWSVAAGTYTVTFSPGAGYYGSMLDGAPAPLSQYYYYSSGNTDWLTYPLGVGLRITNAAAVPEPQIALLLSSGLGVVGWAVRKRRKAVSDRLTPAL